MAIRDPTPSEVDENAIRQGEHFADAAASLEASSRIAGGIAADAAAGGVESLSGAVAADDVSAGGTAAYAIDFPAQTSEVLGAAQAEVIAASRLDDQAGTASRNVAESSGALGDAVKAAKRASVGAADASEERSSEISPVLEDMSNQAMNMLGSESHKFVERSATLMHEQTALRDAARLDGGQAILADDLPLMFDGQQAEGPYASGGDGLLAGSLLRAATSSAVDSNSGDDLYSRSSILPNVPDHAHPLRNAALGSQSPAALGTILGVNQAMNARSLLSTIRTSVGNLREGFHPQPPSAAPPILDAFVEQATIDSTHEAISDQDDESDTLKYDPMLELGEIKARTMHDMVADIPTDDGVKRVLFLSNEQCSMLADTPNCIDKLMEAFRIEKPQLVIQLMLSNGDTSWVDSSKKVWPLPKPLAITSVLEDGKFFCFDKNQVASALHVNHCNGKTFRVKKEGMHGFIKTFEDPEFGCYGRWHPEMKIAAGDWSTGDQITLDTNTACNPYTNYSWKSRRESLQADQRLVAFMQDVIIPLAAQTRAVVLCQAHVPDCSLATAFSKAYQTKKHLWSGQPPFTVIGMTNMMRHMYAGGKQKKFWRTLQHKISSWEAMESRYKAKWPEALPTDRDFDLDRGLVNFIVNDGLEKSNELSSLPYLTLQNEMIRQWTSRVPGFSLVSGFSFMNRVLLPLQSGSQVVFIDQRDRETAANLNCAFQDHIEFRDLLKSRGIADYLQNETLSFFHAALERDGCVSGTNSFKRKSIGGGSVASDEGTCWRRPLHAQIAEVRKQSASRDDVMEAERKEERIEKVAQYVVDACFEDIFDALPDRDERLAKGETKETFLLDIRLEKIRENIVCLKHPRMQSVNCSAIREAKQLIDSLTKVDRVPEFEPLDGLLLLQEAWAHYDIKMFLAAKYKRLAKSLYVIMLILGVLGVTLTVAQTEVATDSDRAKLCAAKGRRNGTVGATVLVDMNDVSEKLCTAAWTLEYFSPDWLSAGVVLVSILTTIVVSIEGYFNAAQRWRKLRTAALSLESAIWMYRTRVGPYATSQGVSPQVMFCEQMERWNASLVSSGDIVGTSVEKRYGDKVYKHYQFKGGLNLSEYADDFHSPMNAQRYISCRLHPKQRFYESRIPKYTRYRTIFQAVLFLSSSLSALLSYFDMLHPVAIVAAVTSAITSWTSFTDLGRKCERYTNAIRGIKDLERVWNTLTPIQQSDTDNITRLICQGERVLNSEFCTWSANTAQTSKSKAKHGKRDDARSAPSKAAQVQRH
eukprot:TRINITY_DN23036_c0_g2_i1.p1 TRINITY_DN23036_c0_g2~~TRINITY_DN23036_c0_g2_i1.p1  ORF type:complete len:1278 (+),score=154.75 TRINITY_DN23036_c0_g2_i1:34-3834(+)